jgi:hypothetical protein
VARDPTTLELGDEIPNTKRPAFLWRLPASHSMVVRTGVASSEFRKDIGLFIIHLLAYLFGTRLQFHNWWFDSRIPTKLQANICDPARTVEPFLSAACRTWKAWDRPDRAAMTALLYMHSRVPGYGWPWECFTFEYMVLDRLYALAATRRGLPLRRGHSQRLSVLCAAYGVPTDTAMAKRIVTVRNNLFHELQFGADPPGFSGHRDALILSYRLRDLNRRLIAATLGWDVPFVHSPWWTLSSVPFDL